MFSSRASARYLSTSLFLGVVILLITSWNTRESLAIDPISDANIPVSTIANAPNNHHQEYSPVSHTKSGRPVSILSDSDRERKRHDHIRSFLHIYETHRPNIKPLNEYKNGKRARKKAFTDKLPIYTNEELGEFLQVSENDKQILAKAQADTIAAFPEYPTDTYSGTGVVFTSGGKYFPIMMVSLKMLRRVSPAVPVEVFVANREEYEPEFCEKVLPTLGAKCVILSEVYGESFFKDFDIHGFQLKILALMASSFENVIFLDSDSVPIKNVESVVLQEPFLSTGYIIWPDYWFRTTSPHYYDIAGIKLGHRVRGDLSVTDPKLIPQADLENALPDKSSESGQLMVSKSKHYQSLLLALYYNLHGYTAYYPLLSQGSGGEGDKETFIAAAMALNNPVHQIKSDCSPVGWFKPYFEGTGMRQVVPIDDYEYHVTKTRKELPREMFVHFNMFKLNARVWLQGDIKNDQLRLRHCGRPSDNVGWMEYQDVELLMWQGAEWTACDMYEDFGVVFKDWANCNMTELCNKTKQQMDWLKRTHST
jgi:alpha 1,2-mannosyltransferase